VEEYVAQQESEERKTGEEWDTWRAGLPSLLSSIAAAEVCGGVV
jgi:hypothetical protein